MKGKSRKKEDPLFSSIEEEGIFPSLEEGKLWEVFKKVIYLDTTDDILTLPPFFLTEITDLTQTDEKEI